jgi:hypothetical protein
VLAAAVAARQKFLLGGLDAEPTDHPVRRFPILRFLLHLPDKAGEMGRQVRVRIPTLDRVLESESLQVVFIHDLTETFRDVVRNILGDGEPLRLVGLDRGTHLIAPHAERTCQQRNRAGEVLLDDRIRRLAGEDGPAHRVDAADAVFRG